MPLGKIRCMCEDHPRLRGEHLSLVLFSGKEEGSPPPTRGTLCEKWIYTREEGITPAYAGNTNNVRKYWLCSWDHPRLRGEHSRKFSEKSMIWGSPPPTRGTLTFFQSACTLSGITPAYAGNTIYDDSLAYISRDHPRLRGEHYIGQLQITKIEGSPPPTRGTRYEP